MKKIPIILIILLSLTCFFLLNKNTQDSESQRLEYATKVSEANARAEYYFMQNKDLISEVTDLKKANKAHREKRTEIKTEWRDKIIIAKAECDTDIINSLDKTHKESEAQCDSSIDNLEQQIEKLEEVVSNDSSIFKAKDEIISLNNDLISSQDKELKKQKRKILIAKIVTGAAVVLAVIALI